MRDLVNKLINILIINNIIYNLYINNIIFLARILVNQLLVDRSEEPLFSFFFFFFFCHADWISETTGPFGLKLGTYTNYG